MLIDSLRDWVRKEETIPGWWKELAAGVAITTLVFLASIFTPEAGILIGVFAPVPVIYYARSGRMQGTAVFLLALLISLVFLNQADRTASLPLLFIWGAFGLVISEMLKKNYAIEKTIFYSALIVFSMMVVFLLSYSLQLGEDPWTLVERTISQGIRDIVDAYSKAGIATDQADLLKSHIGRISKFVYYISPALAVIATVFLAWLNLMAAKIIFARRGISFPDFGDLCCWKIPDKMVWFVIAAGALILVPSDRLRIAGINLLIIFLFIYMFQGLSIIQFFFKKKAVPAFLRGAFYFLLFAQHFLVILVIALGFFDIWVDLRKMNSGMGLSAEKGESE